MEQTSAVVWTRHGLLKVRVSVGDELQVTTSKGPALLIYSLAQCMG